MRLTYVTINDLTIGVWCDDMRHLGMRDDVTQTQKGVSICAVVGMVWYIYFSETVQSNT